MINNSILGGIVIGLGAMFYVITGEPYAFTLGILGIVSLGFPLITGYVPLSTYKQELDLKTLLCTLIGNLIGAGIAGTWLVSIPKGQVIAEKIHTILENKLSLNWMQMLNSSMITGILIGLGVIAYNKQKGSLLGLLMLLMCIMAFVALGTDHVVANAFYAIADGAVDIKSALKMILYSGLGNLIGGIFIGLGIFIGR